MLFRLAQVLGGTVLLQSPAANTRLRFCILRLGRLQHLDNTQLNVFSGAVPIVSGPKTPGGCLVRGYSTPVLSSDPKRGRRHRVLCDVMDRRSPMHLLC